MDLYIKIGTRTIALDSTTLPPVGTRISVHKYLAEDGVRSLVEVTGHDWRLEAPHSPELNERDEGHDFTVYVNTRRVDHTQPQP